MRDRIDAMLKASFDQAEALGFPPFIGPERASTPLNSTPYVAHLDALREGSILSNRAGLTADLIAALDEMPSLGMVAEAVLIGGSAVGPKVDPSDMDCVIFYRRVAESAFSAESLADYQRTLKMRRLDARLIPSDGDMLVMMKALSFFTTLYSKNAGSLEIVRGLILIDCR